jgi:hypothetical protein
MTIVAVSTFFVVLGGKRDGLRRALRALRKREEWE